MTNIKRNLALIGSTAVVATFGVGGIMAAHADTGASPGHSAVQKSETPEVGETADGPDQGPDANAKEPGHQDANESGEDGDAADAADEAAGSETADGSEASDVETADDTETADGHDQGPDANPNQPGHQDANETSDSK